jgi:large subunit ribosomal protein L13e
MVKHNNVIPFQHFHKKWARRVKTWLDQPVQKRIRSDKRKIKAAKLAPRPASGALRPLVHCPTQKYNSKVRQGRGFTLEELKVAGINRQFAQTVGIAVDHRRTNKCEESLRVNVERLKEYKARLVVFPRHLKSIKKGDASKEEMANVQQIVGEIVAAPKSADAVTFSAVSEALKSGKGYATIRRARSDARLVGIRLKQSKVVKDEKKDE